MVLDKYTLIESSRIKNIYNWLQYFSPESLEIEFVNNGFVIKSFCRDVAGSQFDPESDEFAVIAERV